MSRIGEPGEPGTAPALSLKDRRAGAALLRSRKAGIAAHANSAFLERHPEWIARFGDAGSRRGVEDAAYHVEFLAGALEVGEAAAFVDYVGWLVSVLGARGIATEHVVESLELVAAEIVNALEGDTRSTAHAFLRTGIAHAGAAGLPDAALQEPGETPSLESASVMFIHALLQGERQGALGVAREALRVTRDPMDVYVHIFQRALEEIGRLWQLNRITVAQEHLATAIVQFVLAQLYSSLDRSAPVRGNALVTGVEGELHQVGANLVADALELDGWRVRFLGTNVPRDGIIEAVAEMKVDVLGISATMIFNADPVARLVEGVRMAGGAGTPRILVGGGAFRSAPKLWREVGADGSALDVRGACALARDDGDGAA